MTVRYNDLRFPYFVNNKEIGVIGNTQLTVSDAINGAQLVRNNVFVAGKKGIGKTQLLFDVESRYGDHGYVIEGRPDLKTREIFERVNLGKLREAKTTDEIYELSKSIDTRFLGIDELTRCPEITQNELLSLMNGYILFKGKQIQLGNGFCVGLGTGNLGNGEYGGTFKLDAALQDRLHLFLDLDYWKPTDDDMAEIDLRKKADPRPKRAEPNDISDKIIETFQEIERVPITLESLIVGRYFERALDHCSKFPAAEHSKDNLKGDWPVICTQKNCALKDTYCSRIKSVGQRTVEAAQTLAKGLQYIAKLKNTDAKEDPIGAMVLAMRLMLPYTGVISPVYLREDGIFSNPNLAAKGLVTDIEKDIRSQFEDQDKPGPLTTSLAFAHQGMLNLRPYVPTKPEWNFVQPLLRKINEMNLK